METYMSTEEYRGTIIPAADLEQFLRRASHEVDTLTFNRIVQKGFQNLTGFQKSIVKEVVQQLADFDYENRDELQSMVSGYSINGVTVNFGSGAAAVKQVCGITIPAYSYQLLEQSGLCVRMV